jgi:hypothetical protein
MEEAKEMVMMVPLAEKAIEDLEERKAHKRANWQKFGEFQILNFSNEFLN